MNDLAKSQGKKTWTQQDLSQHLFGNALKIKSLLSKTTQLKQDDITALQKFEEMRELPEIPEAPLFPLFSVFALVPGPTPNELKPYIAQKLKSLNDLAKSQGKKTWTQQDLSQHLFGKAMKFSSLLSKNIQLKQDDITVLQKFEKMRELPEIPEDPLFPLLSVFTLVPGPIPNGLGPHLTQKLKTLNDFAKSQGKRTWTQQDLSLHLFGKTNKLNSLLNKTTRLKQDDITALQTFEEIRELPEIPEDLLFPSFSVSALMPGLAPNALKPYLIQKLKTLNKSAQSQGKKTWTQKDLSQHLFGKAIKLRCLLGKHAQLKQDDITALQKFEEMMELPEVPECLFSPLFSACSLVPGLAPNELKSHFAQKLTTLNDLAKSQGRKTWSQNYLSQYLFGNTRKLGDLLSKNTQLKQDDITALQKFEGMLELPKLPEDLPFLLFSVSTLVPGPAPNELRPYFAKKLKSLNDLAKSQGKKTWNQQDLSRYLFGNTRKLRDLLSKQAQLKQDDITASQKFEEMRELPEIPEDPLSPLFSVFALVPGPTPNELEPHITQKLKSLNDLAKSQGKKTWARQDLSQHLFGKTRKLRQLLSRCTQLKQDDITALQKFEEMRELPEIPEDPLFPLLSVSTLVPGPIPNELGPHLTQKLKTLNDFAKSQGKRTWKQHDLSLHLFGKAMKLNSLLSKTTQLKQDDIIALQTFEEMRELPEIPEDLLFPSFSVSALMPGLAPNALKPYLIQKLKTLNRSAQSQGKQTWNQKDLSQHLFGKAMKLGCLLDKHTQLKQDDIIVLQKFEEMRELPEVPECLFSPLFSACSLVPGSAPNELKSHLAQKLTTLNDLAKSQGKKTWTQKDLSQYLFGHTRKLGDLLSKNTQLKQDNITALQKFEGMLELPKLPEDLPFLLFSVSTLVPGPAPNELRPYFAKKLKTLNDLAKSQGKKTWNQKDLSQHLFGRTGKLGDLLSKQAQLKQDDITALQKFEEMLELPELSEAPLFSLILSL